MEKYFKKAFYAMKTNKLKKKKGSSYKLESVALQIVPEFYGKKIKVRYRVRKGKSSQKMYLSKESKNRIKDSLMHKSLRKLIPKTISSSVGENVFRECSITIALAMKQSECNYINKRWRNKYKKEISKDSMTLIIVNASFKGKWDVPFMPSLTYANHLFKKIGATPILGMYLHKKESTYQDFSKALDSSKVTALRLGFGLKAIRVYISSKELARHLGLRSKKFKLYKSIN